MERMNLAAAAILLHFYPVGIIFFVLAGCVIPLPAFTTGHMNCNAHLLFHLPHKLVNMNLS